MIAEEENTLGFYEKSNFKIVKNIGKGCQGQVFQIEHTPSAQLFALKAIYIHPSISEKQKKRIQCEIQSNIDISSHISSINFPKMHHYWIQNDSINILFELCQENAQEGFRKLKNYSQRYNYLFVMIFDILSALTLLQKLNIIHRDIKSENILLKESIFKLTDLGLSRVYENGNSFTNDIGNRLGRSPQFITGSYNCKADIWSLGVHIYYMLENTLPFDQKSLLKIKTDPNKIQNVISSKELQINLQSSSRKSKNLLSYLHLILSQMIVIDPNYRSCSIDLIQAYFNRSISVQIQNVPRIALFGYLYERGAFSEYYLIILLSYLDFYRLQGKIRPDQCNKKKINLKVQLTLLQVVRLTNQKFIKYEQRSEDILGLYELVINEWQKELLKEFPKEQVYYEIKDVDEALQIFKIGKIREKFVLIEWVMKLFKSIEHLKRGMQCYRIPIWQIPLEIGKLL